jgi:hypothetical protein
MFEFACEMTVRPVRAAGGDYRVAQRKSLGSYPGFL